MRVIDQKEQSISQLSELLNPGIWDPATLDRGIFNDIARLAAIASDTQASVINLINPDGKWLENSIGLFADIVGSHSICQIAPANNETLIVEDTRLDSRFSSRIWQDEGTAVSFYARFPLITAKGEVIGALCVMDSEPKRLVEAQISLLKSFSILAVSFLEGVARQRSLTTVLNELCKVNQSLEEQLLWRRLLESAGSGIWDWNVESDVIGHFDSWLEMLGYNTGELAKSFDTLQSLLHPEDEVEVRDKFQSCLQGGLDIYTHEFRMRSKDGSCRWISCRGMVVRRSSKGSALRMIGTYSDVTLIRQSEEAVRRAMKIASEAESRSRMILEAISEGVYGLDLDGKTTFANHTGAEMLGYKIEELLGTSMHDIVHYNHADGKRYALTECPIHASLRDGNTYHISNEVFWKKDGTSIPVEYTSRPVFVEGRISGAVISFCDISERISAQAAVTRLAHYDSVTGLPNRILFSDRLSQELRNAERNGTRVALLYMDLDRFKIVNDSYGHEHGDQLLKEVGNRLLDCVRNSDTVARLGGDEFTIILHGLTESCVINRISQKVLNKLSQPFTIQGHVIHISVSIGITIYPDDAKSAEEMLKNADQAMYTAKTQGRNRGFYFTATMQEAIVRRTKLTEDLHQALKKDQLQVYYQPIIDLRSGQIRKAEALLRWKHPDEGMISPGEFIPLAEETGLIVEIGNWVFSQAALQVSLWRTTVDPHFEISVNKSPVQFQSRYEHSAWTHYLKQLKLPGSSIIVEITESLLLDMNDNVERHLRAMDKFGIKKAIDDFGTGYSSLAYIKKFDIDYLKIDKSFVQNLSEHADDLAICEAVIVMAHKLGIMVVAEGVETVEQKNILMKCGCDFAQGFLFSKPVPPEQFEEYVTHTKLSPS